MSTKAFYKVSEIGKGKPGFSKTRSIIEAAFYGNNVVKITSLQQAYDLAIKSPGTIVTDMPVYQPEKIGLTTGAKVLLFKSNLQILVIILKSLSSLHFLSKSLNLPFL